MYDTIIQALDSQLNDTYGKEITDYDSGYICDVFSEIATNNIDIYYSDIFEWAKENTTYIDESIQEYGNCGDIVKQIQMAQGYANEQELYDNQNDILKYYAYNYLKSNEIDVDEETTYDMNIYLSKIDSNDRLETINEYCDNLSKEIDYEV